MPSLFRWSRDAARAQQLRVFLPHDGIELGSLHVRFLHLLERPSGVHALVLAGVTNYQNPILRAYLV